MDELLEKDFWDTVKTKAKSALNKTAYNAVTKMGGSNQKLSNSVIATDLTKRWNRYLAQRRAGHKKIEGNADDLAFFIKRYFGDEAYSDVESLVDELRVEDNNTTTQNPEPIDNKSDDNNPPVDDYDWHRNKNNTGWYRKLPFKNGGFDYLLDDGNTETGEAWVKSDSVFSGNSAKNPPPPIKSPQNPITQPMQNTAQVQPVVQPQPANSGINVKTQVTSQKPVSNTQPAQNTAPVQPQPANPGTQSENNTTKTQVTSQKPVSNTQPVQNTAPVQPPLTPEEAARKARDDKWVLRYHPDFDPDYFVKSQVPYRKPVSNTQPAQNTAPVQPVVQPQPANPGINVKSQVPYQTPPVSNSNTQKQRIEPTFDNKPAQTPSPKTAPVQPNTFGRKIDWTNPNAINSAMSRANPEQKAKMIATIKNAVQRNPKLVDEFPALKAYESQKSNSLNMLTEDELKTSQVYKVMQGLASYQLTNIKNRDEYGYRDNGNFDNRKRNLLTKIVTINGWNLIMHPENVNNIPNKTSEKYKKESEKYRKMISDRTIREIENQLKRRGGRDSVGELYEIVTDHEHLMDILLHAAAHSNR